MVFVAGTATVAAATDRTLLTWSLTTLTPQWSLALCCHSLAPHPTAGRFAALVAAPSSLNDNNKGEKGDKGDKADKKAHKGGRSSNTYGRGTARHVFLFTATSATPDAAWAVRGGGGGGAALCMLPTSHAFHETVGAGDAAVVLTHDRRLLMAPFGGDVSLRTPGTAEVAVAGVGEQQMVTAPSAFTAAFGKHTPNKKAKAAAAAAGGARAMGGGGASAAAKQLLDVPSHVLPSVLSLCPAFLSALLEENEPGLA